ncbi:MAG: YIP1 family protein [Pseudomonadota bacterium]
MTAKPENTGWDGSYFSVLWLMISKPTAFFESAPEFPGYRRPLYFLVVSSLFYSFCTLTMTLQSNPWLTLVFFVNAVGMPLIVAGIGYPAAYFLKDGRITYARMFSVYAYANGTVLVAAWVPQLTWFCEIAKWILIGVGLVRACGLKKLQAGFVMILTMALTLAAFWLLGVMVVMVKSAL